MAPVLVSRREFCETALLTGGAIMASVAKGGDASPTKDTRVAIDRSGADWNGRPMYLRPYHPTYMVIYYARRNEKLGRASEQKWRALIDRVEKEPDLKIRIVECFDDACAGCRYLRADRLGCTWGVGYTCRSAERPDMVQNVVDGNKRVFEQTGLFFGDEIAMRDLVPVLKQKLPVLFKLVGGASNQSTYEKGLNDLMIRKESDRI